MMSFPKGTYPPYSKYRSRYHNYEIDTIEKLCVSLAKQERATTPEALKQIYSIFLKENNGSQPIERESLARAIDLVSRPPSLIELHPPPSPTTILERGLESAPEQTRKCGVEVGSNELVIRTDSQGFRICSAGTAAACGLSLVDKPQGTRIDWDVVATHEYKLSLVSPSVPIDQGDGRRPMSLVEHVAIGEMIRHMNDRAHYQIPAYAGEQFSDDINTQVLDMTHWIEMIGSSRHSNISIWCGNRNCRRLWGTYEYLFPALMGGYHQKKTESLISWLNDPQGTLRYDIKDDDVIEVGLAYVPLVEVFCTEEVRRRYYWAMLMMTSERYGMRLPLVLCLRDRGLTKAHFVEVMDARILGQIAKTAKIGAFLDVNWKAVTCTNVKRPKGVKRYRDNYYQGTEEGCYRIGEPIRWFKAVSSIEALLGASSLLVSWYLTTKLNTGTFHFLWALVFAPLLHEETALLTLPTRLASAMSWKIVIGVVEKTAHTAMVLSVALVEVLYNIDSPRRQIYTAVVSVFWACSLLTTLLVYITPFYRDVSQILKEESIDPVRTDIKLWNSLVTDPGATNGLRCGGKDLYSGLALAPPDRVSDAGDMWAGSVGHTECSVGTVRMGRIVCVG